MKRRHWTRGFGTELGRVAGEAEADKLAALLFGMRAPDAHNRMRTMFVEFVERESRSGGMLRS